MLGPWQTSWQPLAGEGEPAPVVSDTSGSRRRHLAYDQAWASSVPFQDRTLPEKKKKKRLLLYNKGNVLLKRSEGATNDKEILGKKA